MSDRINEVNLECRCFNVKPIRHTQNGDAVCHARVKLSTQLDDEWQTQWFDLTAWDDAAKTLSDCSHGDDIIIREGRLGVSAYNGKDGIVVEPRITTNKLERVGSFDAGTPSRSAHDTPEGANLPF